MTKDGKERIGKLKWKRSRSRVVGGGWGGGQWVLEEEKARMKELRMKQKCGNKKESKKKSEKKRKKSAKRN